MVECCCTNSPNDSHQVALLLWGAKQTLLNKNHLLGLRKLLWATPNWPLEIILSLLGPWMIQRFARWHHVPRPQSAVWMEGTAEAGLSSHPDHPLWTPSQHQRQFLPAHLHHLPQGSWEPAPLCPRRYQHLHYHPEQRGDAPTHILQGGQESQQQHGETPTASCFCGSVSQGAWSGCNPWFMFMLIIF